MQGDGRGLRSHLLSSNGGRKRRCRTSGRLRAPPASAVGQWSDRDAARRGCSRQGGEKKPRVRLSLARIAGNRRYSHLGSKAVDVLGAAKLCPGIEQRGRTAGNSVAQGDLETVIVHKAPYHRSQKAVAGAGNADGLDRQTIRTQSHIASHEKGAIWPHREGNDLDAIAIEQTTSCFDQRGFVGGGNSRQFLKFAKVGLDEINACFQSGLQKGAGRVHDDLAMRFRSLSNSAEKIMRYAGRQAAARNNKRRRRRDARNRSHAFLPFAYR